MGWSGGCPKRSDSLNARVGGLCHTLGTAKGLTGNSYEQSRTGNDFFQIYSSNYGKFYGLPEPTDNKEHREPDAIY